MTKFNFVGIIWVLVLVLSSIKIGANSLDFNLAYSAKAISVRGVSLTPVNLGSLLNFAIQASWAELT